jgi:hypothetical protein
MPLAADGFGGSFPNLKPLHEEAAQSGRFLPAMLQVYGECPMRSIFLVSAFSLAVFSPSWAQPVPLKGDGCYDSAVSFHGLGKTQQSHLYPSLRYLGTLTYAQPDASGDVVQWVHEVPQAQESYADHVAIAQRDTCNALCSDACIPAGQSWTGYHYKLEFIEHR